MRTEKQRRRCVSVEANRGSVGLNRSLVGPNRGLVGFNNGAVGLNKSSAGFNKSAVGLNKTSAGLNKSLAGINRNSVGLNGSSVEISGDRAGPSNSFPTPKILPERARSRLRSGFAARLSPTANGSHPPHPAGGPTRQIPGRSGSAPATLTPSPGTPGEGWGGGARLKLPIKRTDAMKRARPNESLDPLAPYQFNSGLSRLSGPVCPAQINSGLSRLSGLPFVRP